MPKGYSAKCAVRHREVRAAYQQRVRQLKNSVEFGDISSYVSKQYYLDYLHSVFPKYAIPTIKVILNRTKKEIEVREYKNVTIE